MLKEFAAVLAATLLLLGTAACADAAPTTPDTAVTVAVTSSPISRQLSAQLPATVTFSDRMGVAQIASLRTPLDESAADPSTDYRAGDVAYWAPEAALIVFLSDNSSAPAGDLYLVGHVSGGLEELTSCVQNCPVDLSIDIDG